MKREKALLMLVGAALCWSLAGVLIKWVPLNAMAIAGVRSAFAALVVLAAYPRMRITWSFHQLAGAAAYAGVMITFVLATKMTTAANAILLQYTAPAWVALFGPWFLKERARPSDWATIAVVTGGMILFFLDRISITGTWGNLLAVFSGFCFGWVFLLTRRQKDTSPFESVFLGNVLTALVALPFLVGETPDARAFLGLVLLGVVQLGLAYVLFASASRYVTALDASIILLLEPILNPVWTMIFLGEKPGPWSLIGGAVILGAVTLRAAWPYLKFRRGYGI